MSAFHFFLMYCTFATEKDNSANIDYIQLRFRSSRRGPFFHS